jgi:hypothetical protein
MNRTATAMGVLLAGLAVASGAEGATGTGLFGLVTRGPTAPVCVAGRPCSKPAAGTVLVFSRGGSAVHATARADGTYRVRLAPGVYAVRAASGGLATGSGGLEPASVRVRPGSARRVDFSIDTGIR